MTKNYKNITIKIGTNVLLGQDSTFNYSLIEQIAKTIKFYSENDYRISVVTSGAVGLGNIKLGLPKSDNLALNKVSAAIGNKILFRKYDDIFSDHGLVTAPLLLGTDDFRISNTRKIFGNIKGVFSDRNIIPVINENNTFQDNELKFGDNDALGAVIGNETNSEKLIILSNIDGVYSNMEDRIVVPSINDLIHARQYISSSISSNGTGGMTSKLFAASIFKNQTILANGETKNVLERILEGEKLGTTFDIEHNNKSDFIQQYVHDKKLGKKLETYLLSNI
jgi:glutamate 5-kinase